MSKCASNEIKIIDLVFIAVSPKSPAPGYFDPKQVPASPADPLHSARAQFQARAAVPAAEAWRFSACERTSNLVIPTSTPTSTTVLLNSKHSLFPLLLRYPDTSPCRKNHESSSIALDAAPPLLIAPPDEPLRLAPPGPRAHPTETPQHQKHHVHAVAMGEHVR